MPPPLPSDNPYAAPTARVDDAPTGDLELADRGIRLVATIVDGLVILVPVAFVGIIAAIMIPAMSGNNGMSQGGEIVLGIVGVAVILVMIAVLVINMVLLHRNGQTIAKRWFKIKVLRSDGSRCSLPRIIFARWLPTALLSRIPLLGIAVALTDALMIFRDDHRCLHDLIADTIVVKV